MTNYTWRGEFAHLLQLAASAERGSEPSQFEAISGFGLKALVEGHAVLIGNRKLMEDTLQRQALTDPLTGIANRTVFMDRLSQALRRLERSPTLIGVIYLDLDRFKVINDSLGHELGDRLLVKVADRTLAALRPTDSLARLGGDEFVILTEGLTASEDARHLAERVCRRIGYEPGLQLSDGAVNAVR